MEMYKWKMFGAVSLIVIALLALAFATGYQRGFGLATNQLTEYYKNCICTSMPTNIFGGLI